jgi:hypothetical protein
LHCSLLPSRRGQGNTAQLARGAGGGEFPGERRVLGMHGVDEEISWLSMIDSESRKSSYAMKMRGPCDKCLRAPIGNISGGEKVRYACGFPVLASGLPQVYRYTSTVG